MVVGSFQLKMPINLEITFIFTALCIAASTTSKLEGWPDFILVKREKIVQDSSLCGLKFISRTPSYWRGEVEFNVTVYSANVLYQSLTANAYSDTICHFCNPNGTLVCHQKGVQLYPDVPKSNYYRYTLATLEKEKSISLNPFGDHFIVDQVGPYEGVWIYSLKTGRGRLLIPYTGKSFLFLRVDWDNGYILGIREGSTSSVQVWQLEGNSGAKLRGEISLRSGEERVYGLTLDHSTETVYRLTDLYVESASYRYLNITKSLRLEGGLHSSDPTTFRNLCFNKQLYWLAYHNSTLCVGLHIYRLNFKTRELSARCPISSEDSYYQMAVIEDDAGAGSRWNPCAECSHICLPLNGAGYECACPFGQPLSSATHCKGPLTVRLIARRGLEAPGWHLQTYDAMAKLEDSMISSQPIRASMMIHQPEGYCALEGIRLECFNFNGGSVGSWYLEESEVVARVLEISSDRSVIWLNGTCVKHLSSEDPETVWIFYCDPEIDPNNVVLDTVNPQWSLFFRNTKYADLVHVNLVEHSSTVIAGTAYWRWRETTTTEQMRFAVDFNNQIVYYISGTILYKKAYDQKGTLEAAEPELPEPIYKLGFQDQHLKLVGNLLYWIEIRRNPTEGEEHVVVRFNPETKTKEALVIAARSFSIWEYSAMLSSSRAWTIPCFSTCPTFCEKSRILFCSCPEFAQDSKICVKGVREIVNLGWTPTLYKVVMLFLLVIFVTAICFTVYKVCRRWRRRKRLLKAASTGNGNIDDALLNCLPLICRLDFKNLELDSDKLLGEGNFAQVYEGRYEERRVAIKKLHDNHDDVTFQAFLKELKIMASIGNHRNIIEFIGAEICNNQVHAVLEFCPNSSLDKWLEEHRDKFYASLKHGGSEGQISETSFSNGGSDQNLKLSSRKMDVKLFCDWSHQISSAMAFLTTKRIVHGDLAARNILVFDDNLLKLADFGLARNMYEAPEYYRSRKRKIPWRWSAPEVLDFSKYTLKSDVWSYGVTLWEVFELGKVPYGAGRGCDENFTNLLKEGIVKLKKPEFMPQKVYDLIMRRCLDINPDTRIVFATIEQLWNQHVLDE